MPVASTGYSFEMAFDLWTKRFFVLASLAAGVCVTGGGQSTSPAGAEARAVEFLMREVPAWSRNNGCFSCHNNGDGARALYAATRKGYSVPARVLAETTAWVGRPDRWDHNKGEPGFSDRRLADVQFAAALLASFEAGHVNDRRPLRQAARKLAAAQGADGAWHIESGNTLGSPATYGTPLATYLALRVLRGAPLPETQAAARKAEHWLRQAAPTNALAAAAALLASADGARLEECLKLIRTAQTQDGGWGPYADSPPEPFDTAVTLLALAPLRRRPGVADAIRRGRSFLAAQQSPDGGWPATTRPPGGESYAQRVSTTGWAALALLETKD